MPTASYSRILCAVGQALDLAGARSFSVRESETGVLLDLVDAQGERVTRDLSLADLVDLVNWSERARSGSAQVADRDDEGILRRLLARRERELVGAR
jgi:hypothetical protein